MKVPHLVIGHAPVEVEAKRLLVSAGHRSGSFAPLTSRSAGPGCGVTVLGGRTRDDLSQRVGEATDGVLGRRQACFSASTAIAESVSF